jgi:tetratricopeptide (TPR) repeat protein
MSGGFDQWVWFIDEQLVSALIKADSENPQLAKRAAAHPAIVSAVQLRVAGDAEEALHELSAAMNGRSAADAHLLAGQIRFEMGRFEEAVASYRSLVAIAPDHPAGHYNLGVCLARLRQFEEADDHFQRAVAADPLRPESQLGLGVCLLQQNRTAEARVAFDQCLRLRPDYVPALFGQAVTAQLEGRHEQALAIYRRLLEAKPDQPEVLSNALVCAHELGNRDLVERYAEKTLQADPESRAAILALIHLAMDSGDYEAAVAEYERITTKEPDYFDGWFNLGVCYERLDRPEDAARAYQRAVELQPQNLHAVLAWAGIAALTGTPAVDAWKAVVAIDPAQSGAWYQLGCLYYDSADMAAAQDAFERAAKLEPTMEAAQRALAALAIRKGDADAASRSLARLADPGWELPFNLGLLFESGNRLEEAAECYRNAREQKPDCADPLVNLGHVLDALGNNKEAVECWLEAVRIQPELARNCFSFDR